jgi:uncharacterized protein
VLTIFPCTGPDKGRYEDELLPPARARRMGVIAMKTIRYASQANLPATELLRYALSLDGVNTAIVGLDGLGHLNENAAVAQEYTGRVPGAFCGKSQSTCPGRPYMAG